MKKYIVSILLSLFIGIGIGYYGKYRTTTETDRFNKLVSHCSAAFEIHEKMLRNCGLSFQTINDCYVSNPSSCVEDETINTINIQEDELNELSDQLDRIYNETAEIINK